MKIVRDSNPSLFFSKKEKEGIVCAIQQAEKQTSGEIRVHLERQFKGDVMAHAKEIFERLGMTKTEQRNGVLILLGLRSKRFVILGDQGINDAVPPGFWDDIVESMAKHFREDWFADGIVEAILEAGKKLQLYFPYQRDDINELPDEISCSL